MQFSNRQMRFYNFKDRKMEVAVNFFSGKAISLTYTISGMDEKRWLLV